MHKFFIDFNINKKAQYSQISGYRTYVWGERRELNPRMTGSQPVVLTTSPHSPATYIIDILLLLSKEIICKLYYL